MERSRTPVTLPVFFSYPFMKHFWVRSRCDDLRGDETRLVVKDVSFTIGGTEEGGRRSRSKGLRHPLYLFNRIPSEGRRRVGWRRSPEVRTPDYSRQVDCRGMGNVILHPELYFVSVGVSGEGFQGVSDERLGEGNWVERGLEHWLVKRKQVVWEVKVPIKVNRPNLKNEGKR